MDKNPTVTAPNVIVPKEVLDFYNFSTIALIAFTTQQEELMKALDAAKKAMSKFNSLPSKAQHCLHSCGCCVTLELLEKIRAEKTI